MDEDADPARRRRRPPLRRAAAGADRARRSTASQAEADLILLGGDLTTQGEPDQALVLADACRDLAVPVLAVLGNHDHHAGRCAEITATLEDAGIVVLDRSHTVIEIGGIDVGVVGCKGFVGGFPGAEITDFGESLLRRLYHETGDEVAALEEGLEAIAGCHRRIVLLHYAPIAGDARRRAGADLGVPRLGPARRADRRAPARPRPPRPRPSRLPRGADRRGPGQERRGARGRRRLRAAPLLIAVVCGARCAGSRHERSSVSRLSSSTSSPAAGRTAPARRGTEVLERSTLAELLEHGRADVRRARDRRGVAELLADPPHRGGDRTLRLGLRRGGPCSARASAAVRLPPHVRKSLAVKPAAEVLGEVVVQQSAP